MQQFTRNTKLSFPGHSRSQQFNSGSGSEGVVHEIDGRGVRRGEALPADTAAGGRALAHQGQGAPLLPLQAQDGRRRV